MNDCRVQDRVTYLNKSSNACLALLLGRTSRWLGGVPVWRSTVVRGANSAQLLRSSFGATRADRLASSVHSHRALVSKETHWTQRGGRRRIASSALGATAAPADCRSARSGRPRAPPSGSASSVRRRPATGARARAPSAARRAGASPLALGARPDSRVDGTCGRSWVSLTKTRRSLSARSQLLHHYGIDGVELLQEAPRDRYPRSPEASASRARASCRSWE